MLCATMWDAGGFYVSDLPRRIQNLEVTNCDLKLGRKKIFPLCIHRTRRCNAYCQLIGFNLTSIFSWNYYNLLDLSNKQAFLYVIPYGILFYFFCLFFYKYAIPPGLSR